MLDRHVFDEERETSHRYLYTLQALLALDTFDLKTTLQQAAQLLIHTLPADKVDIFHYDEGSQSLVALGTSDTEMGRHQKALGLDRLPLANRGRSVDIFCTGSSYLSSHADQDEQELIGITTPPPEGLGVASQIGTMIRVNDAPWGVFLVCSQYAEAFSTLDLRFLESVAQWISIVISRVQLMTLQRMEAEARGRRLAAEELLTIMAHDAKNYLTPLRGRLDLIERRAKREGRERDRSDALAAQETLSGLLHLVQDLLDTTRLNQDLFTITPELMCITELVQTLAAALTTPQTPIIVHAHEIIWIYADPNRLRQAVENLLANALTHAHNKTSIEVTLESEKREYSRWCLLTVSNQGSEIPPEVQAHLFEPFAKGAHSLGLGLGLFLAKGIATAHGGTLTVNSSSEHGTHFVFALPMDPLSSGKQKGTETGSSSKV